MPLESNRVSLAPWALLALAGAASAQLTDLQPGRNYPTATANFGLNRSENLDPGDVDNDGDLDVVVANGGDFGSEPDRLFINQGGAQGGTVGTYLEKTSTQFITTLDASRDIELVDYDGDGDLDIYVSNHTNGGAGEVSRFYTNQGGLQGGTIGSFAQETNIRWGTLASVPAGQQVFGGNQGPWRDWSCDCDFADLDDDGDMDMFHSSYGPAINGTQPSRIFLNDGTGVFDELFPWVNAGADINTHTLDADLADMDGDFDIDVLMSSRNSQARVYSNNITNALSGGEAFTDISQFALVSNGIVGSATANYETEYGDLDGDGDFDLWMLNWNGNTDRILRNDGFTPGSGFEFSQVNAWIEGDPVNDENEVDFGDFDGDSDLDAYVANFSGTSWLYQSGLAQGLDPDTQGLMHRTGGGGSLASSFPELPASDSNVSLDGEFFDADNDGDLDIGKANDANQQNDLLINTLGVPDTHAPTFFVSTVQGDKPNGTHTVLHCQVRDNAPYYLVNFYDADISYTVNGSGPFTVDMAAQGSMQFRGIIPAQTDAEVTYSFLVTDLAGNTGVSGDNTYEQGTVAPPPADPSYGGAVLVFEGQAGDPAAVTIPNQVAAGEDLDEEPVIVVPKISGNKATAMLIEIGMEGPEITNLGEFSVGNQPAQAASGDFEDDGVGDVLVANSASGTLTVLKGDGDGSFAPTATIPVPSANNPIVLVLADLNNDTEEDAIVGSGGAGGGVATLLGNGTGSFTPVVGGFDSVPFLTGLDVGLVNAGANRDVVATTGQVAGGPGLESGSAVVLLGDGLGGLAPSGVSFGTNQAVASVQLLDVDKDTDLDALLAIHQFQAGSPLQPTGTLLLFLGSGTGTFAPASWPGFNQPSEIGVHPTRGSLADMNDDTWLDAVYTSSNSIAYAPGSFGNAQPPLVVTTLINNQVGGFVPAVQGTPFAGRGVQPLLRDVVPQPLDGDTDMVLVWTADESSAIGAAPTPKTYIAVLAGDGTGTLSYSDSSHVTTGGMPGDGGGRNVNAGGGGLLSGDRLPPPPISLPDSVDILLPDSSNDSVRVLLGDGQGGIDSTSSIPDIDSLYPGSLPGGTWTGGPHDLQVEDLTADGDPDLVVHSVWTDLSSTNVLTTLSAFVGDDLGGFSKTQYLSLPRAGEFVLGDMDDDNVLDVVTSLRYGPGASTGLDVYEGTGTGTFAAPVPWSQPVGNTGSGGLAVADVDGNGRSDVLCAAFAAGPSNGRVIAWMNTAGGPNGYTLTPVVSDLDIDAFDVISLNVVDVDGDGPLDVLISDSAGLFAGQGLGNGQFLPFELGVSSALTGGGELAVGDQDGDLLADLVCATAGADGSAVVAQLFSYGGGDFGVSPISGMSAATLDDSARPILADMNNDGATDLVLVHEHAGGVTILLNELNGFSTYGGGKAGTGGLVPLFLGKGYSTPGGNFSLVCSNAKPNALSLLMVGVGQVPTGFLHVGLVLTQIVLPLGPTGGFTLPAVLPDDPLLLGLELTLQMLVKDTGAGAPPPVTISASNGLAMLIK